MNLIKAAKIIEFVRSLGVVDFCLCAGARNSPFITLLDDNRTLLETHGQLFSFFEERSASFFALGRAQKTQRPVAVITTSGTAATELISAAVEAFYSQTPLIFITADRPPNYRNTGAPQSIEQIGIFTHYSLPTIDLHDDLSALEGLQWAQKIPLHLNVCFSEPLLQGAFPQLTPNPVLRRIAPAHATTAEHANSPEWQEFFTHCKQPLFILSGLSQSERTLVHQQLKDYSGTWWIESLSGLRGHPDLESGRIKSGERLVQYLLEKKVFDGIIRLGSVPTTRVWRDLEERFLLPVLSLSSGSWSGLARPSKVVSLSELGPVMHYLKARRDPQVLAAKTTPLTSSSLLSDNPTPWRRLDETLTEKIDAAIAAHPQSELHLVRQLSLWVKEQPLYLGNSLPVREWDWVAQPILPAAITGNRGANGIDGQVSTFLGWLPTGQHSWALLGDLTTLYDLSAPWILQQLPNASFTLVIMNNAGGQIFKPMFGREAFINRHNLSFAGWAQMWGLTYLCLEHLEQPSGTPPQILELRPSEKATHALRAEIEQIWTTHLL